MKRRRIISGDIVEIPYKAVDAEGAVVDLSGYTDIDAQLFAMSGGKPSGAAVASKNLLGGVALTTDGTDGRFDVTIDDTDTAALSGDHWLEIRGEDGSGNMLTFHQEIVEIEEDLITS